MPKIGVHTRPATARGISPVSTHHAPIPAIAWDIASVSAILAYAGWFIDTRLIYHCSGRFLPDLVRRALFHLPRRSRRVPVFVCLMTFNRPELVREPVRVTSAELALSMESGASEPPAHAP